MEGIAFISFFLGTSWDFFTETNVSGFDFSFAALFVALLLALLRLRFLFIMLGISGSSSDITFFSTHPSGRMGKSISATFTPTTLNSAKVCLKNIITLHLKYERWP